MEAAADEIREEAAAPDSNPARKSFADQQGIVGSFHPSINSRISRLKKMGADVEWQERKEYHFGPWMLGCAFFVIAVIVLVKSCS